MKQHNPTKTEQQTCAWYQSFAAQAFLLTPGVNVTTNSTQLQQAQALCASGTGQVLCADTGVSATGKIP